MYTESRPEAQLGKEKVRRIGRAHEARTSTARTMDDRGICCAHRELTPRALRQPGGKGWVGAGRGSRGGDVCVPGGDSR